LERRELERVLDDTYFFLPHVRSLLFPETEQLPPDEAAGQLQAAEQLAALDAGELVDRLPDDAVVRLTASAARADLLRSVRLTFERTDERGEVADRFAADFYCDWIDVALFPQGIGFLLLKVRPAEQQMPVGRLSEFFYYLRLVHPPAVGWQMAQWQIATPASAKTEASTLSFSSRALIDFLLQGLADSPCVTESLEDYVNRLPQLAASDRATSGDFAQIYGDAFHLFSYTCMATSGESATSIPPSTYRRIIPFDSATDRCLYELATCTDTTQPDYVPDADYTAQIFRDGGIAFWQNWRALALHENVAFLAEGDSRFAARVLPHNIENDYLPLYLLVLFQKCRLSVMFGKLVRRDQNLARDVRKARRLWDAFLRFQNAYWYSEPTRRPLATELYGKLQQALGVQRLYEELKGKIDDLRNYYEQKLGRRISGALSLFTFIAVPTGIAIQIYSMTDQTPLATIGDALRLLSTLGIAYLVAAVVWLLWIRRHRE
jgi:hypothetical protein